MRIEVRRHQASDRDVKVRAYNGDDAAHIHAVVECSHVVMMGEESIDFGLDKDVGDCRRQRISVNLLVLVELIGLLNDC